MPTPASRSSRRLAVALLALCAATALVAVAVAGSIGPFATPDRTLVVADADSGERLLEVPVADGEEVTLAYTHSVEKTPVEDVYVVDGTDLRMDRMVFDSFGAGLPSEADVERTDDGLVASVDRTYEEVVVSPGSIAGHELRHDGDRYDLVERSDGSAVVLFVEEGSGNAVLEAPGSTAEPRNDCSRFT